MQPRDRAGAVVAPSLSLTPRASSLCSVGSAEASEASDEGASQQIVGDFDLAFFLGLCDRIVEPGSA